MSRNNLIYKDNKIIEASYSLTLIEQRILLLAISQINSAEKLTDNEIFQITASDYSLYFSIGKKESFREMKIAIAHLSKRWVKVIDDGDTVREISWISSKSSTTSKQTIEVRFSKDIAEYLGALKGSFTKYRLLHISNMSSVYSIRIYEMLMRWKVTRTLTLTVEQLKDRLLLTSKGYILFGSIKQKVVDPAMREIALYSDITPCYELIKQGKKVVAIKFSYQFKDGVDPQTLIKAEARLAIGAMKQSLGKSGKA